MYDSHELFTEIPELTNKPFVKSIWLKLENSILPKLKNCYTVCDSIANFYNKKYKTNFKIIRNLPLKKRILHSSFPFFTQNKKIILYQGVINIGRGLELIIETMTYLKNHLLIIIGDGDVLDDLKEIVLQKNLQEKVKFIDKIFPEELQKLTPLANIGISLEENLGLNYHFALPNKVFDYIQANVPILVSDLPEMKQLVIKYNVGEIVKNRNPKSLAKQINEMLKKNYSKELNRAKNQLIWELEKEKLLLIFNNLM